MNSKNRTLRTLDFDPSGQSESEQRLLKSRLPHHAVETVAREVLQRLALRDADVQLQAPHHEDIEFLCHALLSEDETAGAQYISDLRTDGASIEAVYLTYLAGAARLLGTWWDEDRIPFTGTILGTSRMYAIMRAQTRKYSEDFSLVERSAVFVAVPDETHILGVRMAAELFQKDGWNINLKVNKSHDQLIEDISQLDKPIVGISAGGISGIASLSKLIIALRISNPKAQIFVSGKVVDEARDAVEQMGVDGIVSTVEDAKNLMASMWDAANQSERAR